MCTMPRRMIGVTGFMTAQELRFAQDLFGRLVTFYGLDDKSEEERPQLMAGILVSRKTANGIPDRYPNRYPKPEALPALLQEASRSSATLSLVHYNTDTPDNLLSECEKLIQVAGPNLQGLQLNLCWPHPALTQELHRRYPDFFITLQVGSQALQQFELRKNGEFCAYEAIRMVVQVQQYEDSIQGILLDPSGGRGETLQSARLLPLVQALTHRTGLSVGVAGGLSGRTIGLLNNLPEACPYLSIDAEGRLRNLHDDSLNLSAVAMYLSAAFDIFYC